MNKDMRARLTAMTAERDTAMVHYTIMAQKAQQHLALVREVHAIAETGILPDGDGVNVPTLTWAEDWAKQLSR